MLIFWQAKNKMNYDTSIDHKDYEPSILKRQHKKPAYTESEAKANITKFDLD